MMDRTNHNRLASQFTARISEEAIPATDRLVSTADNMPSRIDFAAEAMEELRAYLKNHPVITTQDEAKLGANVNERTLVALNEARTERETQTRPFRDKLNAIFAVYELVKDKGTLETARGELRKRLTKFATEEENKRLAELARLQAAADEKERLAREAEEAEREAIDDAEQGVESDVGGAIEQADHAFGDFQRADRLVAVAAKHVPVRFGSVLGGRSRGMRNVEVLVIEDVAKAIKILGITEEIRDAILSAARKYRKEFEELPAGITATFERSL